MLNIGHRGASGTKPENTLEAFAHAFALGSHGIELDVRRCATGELVVIHDATLTRTVKKTRECSGRVSRMTLAELKKCTVHGNAEQVPTLEETFHALGKQKYCFIELKTPEAAKDVAKLVKNYVEQGWRADRLILITFRHKALIEARKHFPGIHIGASFKRLSAPAIRKAVALGAQFVTPNFKSVNQKLVTLTHSEGLKLVVWTVNKPENIARMQELGVDGIMTDFPDRISQD